MKSDLRQLYNELFYKIGIPASEIVLHWNQLEKAYTSKSRYYHNLDHIKAMTNSFELYKHHLKKPDEVLFSIFYHDFIYKATKTDNEVKSAEYGVKLLLENEALDKSLIYEMICATKLHLQSEKEDINWLIDFDLKILATDWNTYKSYCNQIRKEYKIYPDFLYKPGRKKALLHFLEHDFIYQTTVFREKYETKARQNIKSELLTL